jgi:hypothetical protein
VPGDYAGELPVVEDLTCCAGEVSFWNFIDVGKIDRLGHIEFGIAAAEREISRIARDEAAGAEGVGSFRGVIDIVRPGIAELSGEAVIIFGAQKNLQ